ncbi:MAG TPA: hypothetical protein VGR66_01335 [Candidatus Eisenbacteria bacterium]|nr:hypothetical protein [Candidatus Eisenbacteria bacterium]
MIRPRWALAALAAGLVAIPSVVHAQYAPGQGSLGATFGVPIILGPGELKWGQEPRLMGKGNFQYVINRTWRASFKFGYGWSGYNDAFNAPFVLQAAEVNGDTTKGDQLVIMNPFTATVHFTRALSKNWMWYVGGGPGVYRVNITNDHRTIYDPVTHERFKFGSFGISGTGGMEYFLPSNKNVSLLGVATVDHLFSSYKDRFPSGYAGPYTFMDVSIGVNVYFKPLGSKSTPTPAALPSEAPPAGGAPTDTTKTSP